MVRERVFRAFSGWPFLLIFLGMIAGGAVFLIGTIVTVRDEGLAALLGCACVLGSLVGIVGLFGFMAVAPNDARVLLLFGEYKGTVKDTGFFWVNPFCSKRKVSLRVRNFETGSVSTPEQKDAHGKILQARGRTASKPSKVNDRDGNPIEISAVVVWKVVNTAEALFEVDDYEHYVEVQSEAALRSLASRHPYDSDYSEISLRGNTVEVCEQLRQDIRERLDKAGVDVIEARISHLAYAPEIAAAMLQRQQAQAVVAARQQIVEGVVGMVRMALDHLADDNIVDLDKDQRSAMVSNLLVVLCSDRRTQPVVNTGAM